MIVREIIQLETFDQIEKGDFVDIDSNKLAVIREKTAVGLVLEKTGNSVTVEVKRLICNFEGTLNIGDSAVLSNGRLVASSNGNFRILQVKEKAVAVPLIKLSEGGGSFDLFAEYGGDDLPPSTDKIYSSEKISELFGNVIDTIYPINAPYYQIVGQHSDPQVLYPNTVWELINVDTTSDILKEEIDGYVIEKDKYGYMTIQTPLVTGYNPAFEFINYDYLFPISFIDTNYTCQIAIELTTVGSQAFKDVFNKTNNSGIIRMIKLNNAENYKAYLIFNGKFTNEQPSIENPQGFEFQKIWVRVA